MIDDMGNYNWLPRDLLEGKNLRSDLVTRELIPAGPVPAAVAA